MSGASRRKSVLDATFEALRHKVGRDEHMPLLKPRGFESRRAPFGGLILPL